MNLMKALRTVDTVTRVARKVQLMIKDAPKVGKILTEYDIERKFKNHIKESKKVEQVKIKSRNRFKPIEL